MTVRWNSIVNIIACAILIFITHSLQATEEGGGYGKWKFGMSKEEVRSVSEYAPYYDVEADGGLETYTDPFDCQKIETRFLFDDTGLYKITLDLYEGKDVESAIKSWYCVYEYLKRNFGEIESPEIVIPSQADIAEFKKIVEGKLSTLPNDRVVKIQLKPKITPTHTFIFSSIIRHPEFEYYVFLHFCKPK